jgi:hypothetical protein
MQDSYLARYNLTKFLFPAAILLCFIIAYWTSYQKMSIRWSGGDNNYCYLVVPLFLYLCWDMRGADKGKKVRRREGEKVRGSSNAASGGFRFEEFSWSIWGLIPIFFSILLILVGELGSVETLLYIGYLGM